MRIERLHDEIIFHCENKTDTLAVSHILDSQALNDEGDLPEGISFIWDYWAGPLQLCIQTAAPESVAEPREAEMRDLSSGDGTASAGKMEEMRSAWRDYVDYLREKYPQPDGEFLFKCPHHHRINEVLKCTP